MNIDFDELEAICPHNSINGCDLQIENEAVTMMDGGEGCDNVACCEKQCPLNVDINKQCLGISESLKKIKSAIEDLETMQRDLQTLIEAQDDILQKRN